MPKYCIWLSGIFIWLLSLRVWCLSKVCVKKKKKLASGSLLFAKNLLCKIFVFLYFIATKKIGFNVKYLCSYALVSRLSHVSHLYQWHLQCFFSLYKNLQNDIIHGHVSHKKTIAVGDYILCIPLFFISKAAVFLILFWQQLRQWILLYIM